MLSKLKANRLLSGSVTYLLSNIASAAIPFVLLPVLTRHLSPTEYGQVAMFLTLSAALGGVIGLNVVGAAGRKYYDNPDDTAALRGFIGACMQILMLSTLAVLAVMALLREPLALWLGLPAPWVLGAALMTACSVLVQIRLGQWQVRSQARPFGVLQVGQALLNMLLSLLLVVGLLQGAPGRMTAQLATAAVAAAAALWLLGRDGLLGWADKQAAHWKEALAFGVPLVPHVAGLFLLSSVDRIVINGELGLAEAGIYMVAVQLAGVMAMVFDAVNSAYVPWLFERLKRDRPEEKRQIVRYTYLWFGLILLVVALAFVAGPTLVTLVAGPGYARSGEVIGWLALGQGFGGMYLMVTNYIFYSKRTGMLAAATLSSGFLNIVLLLLLVRLSGLQGAAVAYCVAMAARFLLTWWVAQRRYPMPWFGRTTSA